MGNVQEEKSTMNVLAVPASEEARGNVNLTVHTLPVRHLLQLPASTQDGRHTAKGERMRTGINMDSRHAQEYQLIQKWVWLKTGKIPY